MTGAWTERISPRERSASAFAKVAIAAERQEAARAGVAMIDAGGNAVDAAVAVAFATCVVQPSATTIAGSGFMMVSEPGRRVQAVEFPARAPAAARPAMFDVIDDPEQTRIMGLSAVRDAANSVGPLSAGVPAAVAGLCEAQRRFGRLALREVMSPAIALAQDGFAVNPEYQLLALSCLSRLQQAGPGVRGTLLTDDGLPPSPPPGFSPSPEDSPRVRQPDLAATLAAIAEHGPEAFYTGPIARTLVDEVQRRGGILTEADLAAAAPIVGDAVELDCGGWTAAAPTSPNGAWTALAIAAVAQEAGALQGTPAQRLRLIAAASDRAFADRYHFLADPDFADVPLDRLLDLDYLRFLAADVVEAPRARHVAGGAPPWVRYATTAPELWQRYWREAGERVPSPHAAAHDHPETTHLSVVDADGMMASCTLTAGGAFGSCVRAAGVLLDNAMVWFDAVPGRANSIAPGKRPLVNMGPMIVHNGARRLAVGAPGGRRVVSAVAQVTLNWLGGMGIDAAVSEPRIDASGHELLVSDRVDAGPEELAMDGPVQSVDDRYPYGYEFARPVAVEILADGTRAAATQPFVSGVVVGS